MSGRGDALAALAQKRRLHREAFKKRSLYAAGDDESSASKLARKLVHTRSLLLAVEQRAAKAERKLDEMDDCELRKVSTNSEEKGEEQLWKEAREQKLKAAIGDVQIESVTFACTMAAESNTLRCELAASACREAASVARCQAAEVELETLRRSTPPLHENDDGAVGALVAVCEALRAAERNTFQNERDLIDKLSTSENKVKILESHLAKMDAHLAALAHGGEESLPSADSAEFFHRDSDDEEDSFDNGAATVESPAQEDIVETTTVSSVADAVAEINIASFEETLPVESSVEDLSTVVQGLRQELELAHAALEGAGSARSEAQDRVRDQEKENEILVERVAKLEGQLVATQALIASSEQARENDSRKARRQLLAKDSRISEANEASKMMAEDMLASKARQAEALLEYSESMQLQAAALSSRLNEAIAATNEAAVNEDHSSHLEKVVQKCTSTIEDLRNSLAVESSKSDTLVTELQTVSTSREELKKDLESANARADVAEARAETALEKAKSAALLVEVAEERIQEARNRCEKAEEVAEAARKRCDIAERERHSIAQDRDEVVSASQENVIVAETAVAKLHEELSENRSAVANDAEEFASKALDALNAANVVSEARLAQIRREHSRILEDREIALSAAREEVSLHRQRALQYEAVAAKAFAEYAATAGAFAAGGIVSPKSTTGRTSTAHTVTDSINSQSELASANSMHSRSKSVRGFDARTSRIRTTPDARHVSPNNSVLEAALLKESNQDSTANDLNDTFGDPGEDPDSRKTFTTFGTFDDADEDVSSFATTKTLATVATATAWEGVFSQQDAASSRGVSPKKLAVHELESSMAPSLARILIATTAFHVGSHTQARRLRLLSWAAWKNYNHMGRWQTVASLARGYVIRSLLAQIAMRRCTTAFRQWHRNPVSKSTLSRESSRVPIRSASYGREKQGHPAYASIDRVAAMAAGISAAARLARGEPTNKSTTSQFTNRDGPILFRRSVDASGGVIGVDNKELCPAFQFGNCEHQSQTGLVLHKTVNGGMVWRWHACVACARTTGRLATHPRFAVQGEVKQCPIAEHENDRLYETLPSEMSKSNCYQDQSLSVENVRLMRAQERRIKEYEHQRDELMSALGAALMHLSGLGVSYPTWWWAMYEKSRVSIHK